MRRPPDKLPLLAAIMASLMLHAALLIPLLLVVMSAPARPPTVAGRFDPEDLTPPNEPPAEETILGIDAQTPSTLTWVGHRVYQEHLAARAEFEQAAFTQSPPAPVAPPVETPPESPASAPPEARETTPPEAALPPLIAELLRLASAEPSLPLPPAADGAAKRDPERPAEPAPDQKPAPTPVEGPPSPTDPAPPVPPEPAPDGDPADKEADPTSVIEVPLDQIKRGMPLARPGLELKPQRPHFTTLTLLTAAPCDPLVRITFRRDGRPTAAKILKTSCDHRVDAAVENSLYRWRASGKDLERLGPEETLDVELRIVLGGR